MIEDDLDWLEEFAVAAGFDVDKNGNISIPEDEHLDELLETFANIVAEVSVKQFITRMSEEVRGEETLH